MRPRYLLALAPLALGGCAELAGAGAALGSNVQRFVTQVHDMRYAYRQECFELVKRAAGAKEQAGDTEGALKVYADYMPRLVTTSTVLAAVKDNPDLLDTSWGCERRTPAQPE